MITCMVHSVCMYVNVYLTVSGYGATHTDRVSSPGRRGNLCHNSSVRKGMNGDTSLRPLSKHIYLVVMEVKEILNTCTLLYIHTEICAKKCHMVSTIKPHEEHISMYTHE